MQAAAACQLRFPICMRPDQSSESALQKAHRLSPTRAPDAPLQAHGGPLLAPTHVQQVNHDAAARRPLDAAAASQVLTAARKYQITSELCHTTGQPAAALPPRSPIGPSHALLALFLFSRAPAVQQQPGQPAPSQETHRRAHADRGEHATIRPQVR